MTETLEQWLQREYRYAATAMLRSVSARDIVKERPGFGQTMRPVAGSVIASPIPASYDPDPDYFFHWFRDSAVVMDAVRLLYEAGDLGSEALTYFADFVRFSLSLRTLDGPVLAADTSWRTRATPDFQKFLRGDDLLIVLGDAVYADTRVNPDGTLDISRWARPQHDGSPLRALTLLKWLRTTGATNARALDAATRADTERLLRIDLRITASRWREPSHDIWEEELGLHYFTLRVSAAALAEGAKWLHAAGETAEADELRDAAQAIRSTLDGFWLAASGYYRSRIMPPGVVSTKMLDIAVILSAIHSGDDSGGGDAHSVRDPRMQSTLASLEQLFDRLYPINHERPSERATAMGRYEGDVYYSGGAYFFSTLGASEFCFLAAQAHAPGSAKRRDWIAHGDGFLETVRAFTLPGGDLSEQFDQRTGEQTSAKHLAWSYAALISCVTARREALLA